MRKANELPLRNFNVGDEVYIVLYVSASINSDIHMPIMAKGVVCCWAYNEMQEGAYSYYVKTKSYHRNTFFTDANG